MGHNQDSGSRTAQSIAAVANSKAAEKLAGAIDKSIDYIAGPKRILAVSSAKSLAALEAARTESDIEILRAETAERLLDQEMRKTINRRSIITEAFKALPLSDETVSEEPVSKDFVPNVLDEFDDVSDIEVHKIVGRLIAGEITTPGSFPRRTIRILREMDSRDFEMFRSLCRFAWHINERITPIVVLDPNDSIYVSAGLNFDAFRELESLRLISLEAIGFRQLDMPPRFNILYGNTIVQITLKEGENEFSTGHVLFTDAGQRLYGLTQAQTAPESIEYVLGKWKQEGHKAEIVGVIEAPTTSQADVGKAA